MTSTPNTLAEIQIDTDCALASWNEDPDDAFAVIYSLLGPRKAQQIYSVGGNTTAEIAARNCEAIVQWLARDSVSSLEPSCKVTSGLDPGFNFRGPLPDDLSVESQSQSNLFSENVEQANSNSSLPIELLGLGPLTNVARWISHNPQRLQHLWCTLGRIQTKGFLPPLWPVEFNATQDLIASEFVFRSSTPITVVPLDIACQLRVTDSVWQRLNLSSLGRKLQRASEKWRWRSRLIKGNSSFPAWDLVSSALCENPQWGRIEKGQLSFFKNGLVLCDPQNQAQTFHSRSKAVLQRPAKIVCEIDREAIWNSFFDRLQRFDQNENKESLSK